MSLTVMSAGLFTIPVGDSRPGDRAFGVPLGGAADRAALALANGLVGNAPTAVGLEVTLNGPTLRAEVCLAGVVFGAPFELRRNDEPLEPGTTFVLQPGDQLRIGGTPAGCRAYLCVHGGFASVNEGKPVQAGDRLTCPSSNLPARSLGFSTFVSDTPDVLRVLPGPQADWFPADAISTHSFRVSPSSNRMGIRLAGPPLVKREAELVSEAVAPGAVQVTNDGLPVILGVDGQTIGGYPKVAHVIRADLDKLGQLRPENPVSFQTVSESLAEELAGVRNRRLRNLLVRLGVTNSARRDD